MFEVSESAEFKPVDQSPVTVGGKTWPALVRDTIVGAINTKLIQPSDQIVSIYHRCAASAPLKPHFAARCPRPAAAASFVAL